MYCAARVPSTPRRNNVAAFFFGLAFAACVYRSSECGTKAQVIHWFRERLLPVKLNQKHDGDGCTSPTPRIATFGEVFDGASIELIRDPATERPCLLLWDGAMETVGSVVEFKGRFYVPAPMDPSLLRELTLPTHCRPHGSTRELLADIRKLIGEFVALPDKFVSLAARLVLVSWLIEAVGTSPGLTVTGPDVLRGNQLLSLLHCLCRHPIRMTGVTPAQLCSLPTAMGFTLLISQSTISDKLQALLDDASKRDQKIPHKGGLLDLFGCQVLHSETVLESARSSFRFLQIPMLPGSQNLPSLDLTTRRRIAADFQPRLLGFRRANLYKAQNGQFDTSGFIFPLRQLVQSLATATPDDADLQAEVVDLLHEEDTDVRSAKWIDLSTTVLEAVLVACHQGIGTVIYVGELAAIAQEIGTRRGQDTEVDPGAFGKRLKLLGFATEPRDAKGFRLRLTEEVYDRARQLADDFGVPQLKAHGVDKE